MHGSVAVSYVAAYCLSAGKMDFVLEVPKDECSSPHEREPVSAGELSKLAKSLRSTGRRKTCYMGFGYRVRNTNN